MGAPASGDVCSTAQSLTLGVTLSGQVLSGFDDDYTAGCNFGTGPDRVYAVQVPSGQGVTVTVTPDAVDAGRITPRLTLLSNVLGCGTQSCGAVAPLSPIGQPTAATYANTTSGPQTVYAVVDVAPAPGSGFSILATLGALPPQTPGRGDLRCSRAFDGGASPSFPRPLGAPMTMRSAALEAPPQTRCLASSCQVAMRPLSM